MSYPIMPIVHPHKRVLSPVRDGLICELLLVEGRGGTIKDSSGLGNNATISGAIWRRLSSGKNILYFDGIDDSGTVSSVSNYMGEEFTIEMLWRPRGPWVDPEKGWVTVFSRYSFNRYGWAVVTQASTNRLLFITFYDGGSNTVFIDRFSGYFGTWLHLVCRFRLGELQDMWVNGELKAGPITPEQYVPVAGGAYLGYFNVPSDLALLRVYQRILSEREIKMLCKFAGQLVPLG